MQTFLPQTNSFERIAQELDNKRLHKQTLEGWQVLLALTKLDPQGNHRDPKGWVNHPVAIMWRGHEKLLVSYLAATYYEWIGRGFKSTMLPKIFNTYDLAVKLGRIQDRLTMPSWMKDTDKFERLASTHRVALLRKDYSWYSQFGWTEDKGYRPEYYQYLWPDLNGDLYLGTFNNL
jgi:hypothetical protein